MATNKVLSVVLAVAMFLTLMTFAAVGAGETAALGVSPVYMTRTNARNATQTMASLVVLNNGAAVAASYTFWQAAAITNEYAVPGSLDITRGAEQRNNGRWRFNQGRTMGDDDNSVVVAVYVRGTITNAAGDTEVDWRQTTSAVNDRWNLGATITSSRVWASVGVNGDGYLNLDAHPSIAATGSVTSNDRIALTIDGRRVRGQDLRLEVEAQTGGRENIEDGDDIIYMDTPDSRRIRVLDFINRARIYTEYNGIITTRLHQRDYYVHVSNRPTVAQMDIMDAFGFETIRILNQIGLPITATITWDMDFNFWVYTIVDGALVFLGRSNDQLPLVDVYFFSAVELAVDDAIVEPGEDDDDWEAPADGGPVGNVPGPNYNPPTGR